MLYYNALSKKFPGMALTTSASLMMLDTYEYFSGPAGKIQSFLMVPACAKEMSVSMYNLIKSATKFPYAVYCVRWIVNLVYKSISVYPMT